MESVSVSFISVSLQTKYVVRGKAMFSDVSVLLYNWRGGGGGVLPVLVLWGPHF